MDVSDLVRPGILKRLARSPACHFVVVGILLFLADGVWSRLGATSAARTIVLTGADVRQLRRSFEQQFGRAPNPREETALVDHAIDEEVLYRRALELGLDRGNRVVRQRLVATLRLVADDVAKDDESLYREALRLQLDRTDVVVRRHLVQLVSLLLKRAGAIGPIREADLRRLLERDADRYRRAETITFTQVYLDPARRGARLEADTARILAALRSGRPAEGAGDPFLLGSTFTRRSQAEIRRLVGDRVADWTAQATLGDWLGPVRSTYGVHLLRVDERIPGHLPAVAEVRNQLVAHLLEERGESALREKTAALRAEYAIRLERAGPAASEAPRGTVLPVPRPVRELGD